MSLGAALSGWLLDQLENMPLEMLRGSSFSGPRRLLDVVYGEQEAEALRAMIEQPRGEQAREAAILMPGLMGSLLASVRGISGTLWPNPMLMLNGHINLLELDDDGIADRAHDIEIVPVGIEKLCYLKLILSLSQQTRLYEFPYDWRRRLEHSAELLHRSIARWSSEQPERRFVLVGHSLGGQLARTYLALYPQEAEQRVARVVMIGTPLYGAPLAMLTFVGEAPPTEIIARLHPDNNVLRLIGNMPVSYQLLPAPPDLFPPERAYPANWDLYRAEEWHLPHVRQDYLDEARRLHELLASSDPQVPIVEIAGCHRCTTTDVWRDFEIEAADGRPRYTVVEQEEGADSGDDSVPLWSAHMPGIDTYYVEAHHQLLPSNTQVLDAVTALVHGQAPDLPSELPPPSGLLDRLSRVPLVQQVVELRQRFESGAFRGEDLQKLLLFSR